MFFRLLLDEIVSYRDGTVAKKEKALKFAQQITGLRPRSRKIVAKQ
jgi:hypothetical protein